jgi:hypothetical protein
MTTDADVDRVRSTLSMELVVKRSLVRVVTFCAVIVAAGKPASAQQYPGPGTAVLVGTDTGAITGVVHRRTWDSLLVRVPSAQVIPLRRYEITWVRSYGVQYGTGAKRGAKVGAIVGAALVGVAIVTDTHARQSGQTDEYWIPMTVLAVPAGVLTTVAGTLIGLVAAPTGWSGPRRY